MPTKPIKLTLLRTGGVAGIRPPADELDTASLSPAQGQRIAQLLETAAFFTLPCELPERSPQPDSFQYTLSARVGGGRAHTVTFTDQSADEPLRQLKKLLREIARGQG